MITNKKPYLNISLQNIYNIILFIMVFYLALGISVSRAQDSVSYNYSIVGMAFYDDHDIIKIKVPPWLKTSELISQIKGVIFWPGEPPPDKKTYIYVFKETDQVGETSNTGAIYIPNKGFLWSLSNWHPVKIPDQDPSEKDITIYQSFIDRIIENGSTFNNQDVKRRVAGEYNISIYKLDSIYTFVKFWLLSKQEQ